MWPEYINKTKSEHHSAIYRFYQLLNLKQWCDLDESLYSSQTGEEYNQYAGLDFRREIIERLAEVKIINSEIFINFLSHPRPLLIGAIEDIAYSKTKKLELELHNTRNEKIASSKYRFNDSPVNWSNWRQFNSHEKELQSVRRYLMSS